MTLSCKAPRRVLFPISAHRQPTNVKKKKKKSRQLSTNWVIRFVPAELWRSIFRFVSASSPFDESGILRILGVSQVCSSWRSITDNSPELWTNVVLRYNGKKKRSFPNANFHSYVLKKSRGLPLTMGILAATLPTFSSVKDTKALELYLKAMHRAKMLRLQDADILYNYIFQHSREEDIPDLVQPGLLLEKIEIDMASDAAQGSVFPLLSRLWKPAPLVSSMSFFGLNVGEIDFQAFRDTKFPFHQITSLEFNCPVFDDTLELMVSLMPALVNISLHSICQLGDDFPDPTREELLDLRTVSLGGPSYITSKDQDLSPLMDFFEYFSAPALTTLRLSFDSGWTPESFTSFLERSTARIQHLHFDILDATDSHRIECLKLLPSLRTLNLSFTAGLTRDFEQTSLIGKHFLDAMSEWDASEKQFVICPRLKQLTIDYDTLADPTTVAFADMVEDRWRLSTAGKKREFEVVVKEAARLGGSQKSVSEMVRLLLLQKVGLKLVVEPRSWLEGVFDRNLL
ncbi:hypothetical protein CVT26_015555 [Gymnopilus dilepis]|uniref:F-box domain-containing protein n=1 Tax=Gymnopilus dilepis TaxID=231916 RepID=A0A409YD96_9AGAR|nr:hypothetical protein CVT26_015555 [Gymnopilus dilepis]